MKKIKLDLDSLKVESFVTSGGSARDEGTVFGMDPNTHCEWTCNEVTFTCNNAPTGGCDSGDCDWTQPLAATCTSVYETSEPEFCTTPDTEVWTCEPMQGTCNNQECKTE
jgi:hypothetical protein